MRKCIRCNTEMVEDLDFLVVNSYNWICIKEKGLFKSSLGKVKCAVCKDCGYVETYLEKTDKIQKFMKDRIPKI